MHLNQYTYKIWNFCGLPMSYGHLLHVVLWTALAAQDLFGKERCKVESEL